MMNKVSSTSGTAVLALAEAATRMPVTNKAFWATRLSHVYGEMNGQRAVSFSSMFTQDDAELNKQLPSQTDAVIGLEVYYSLICLLMASASLHKSPSKFVVSILNAEPKDARKGIMELTDGRYFEQYGIYGFRNSLDLDWLPEALSQDGLIKLLETLNFICGIWEDNRLRIEGVDPLQVIHRSIFPKNLMHITGQFYSPEWLAQTLIKDIGYTGEGRLIDPFCGSGVFLLTALNEACSNGISGQDAIHKILGIDLNPSACIAAKCNLVMWISNNIGAIESPISLNVLNADAIAPSIVKGNHAQSGQHSQENKTICVDGSKIPLTPGMLSKPGQYTNALRGYGVELKGWTIEENEEGGHSTKVDYQDRRINEQLSLFNISPAEFLATNPPWVGWEYMSKSYRSEIQPAWDAYDLFSAKGLNAAFLKEDLSTLAMMSAWDLYLEDKGRSAAVLKPSTMKADLTGRGIRRLSLQEGGTKLRLEKVREFEGMKVFSDAQTETCCWSIQKGYPTQFPVPVITWKQVKRRWSPQSFDQARDVRANVKESDFLLQPTNPDDFSSRWMIAKNKQILEFSTIQGTNKFSPRMGVFTGGANAIFYLEKIQENDANSSVSTWSNIVHRAKRSAPKRILNIENSAVRSVARGRDIEMWRVQPEVFMLFPHDSESKMYPISEDKLPAKFPLAWQYLKESEDILKSRKGFAGWEKKIHADYFYTLQRVGEYTFSPYKVCWKYVCSEFTICVFGAEDEDRDLLPNDKVMFIPFENREEAFYVGGVLSSQIVRQYVHSCMSSRQISTNIIKNIRIPDFDPRDELQACISQLCEEGHHLVKHGKYNALQCLRDELDQRVSAMYLTEKHVRPA